MADASFRILAGASGSAVPERVEAVSDAALVTGAHVLVVDTSLGVMEGLRRALRGAPMGGLQWARVVEQAPGELRDEALAELVAGAGTSHAVWLVIAPLDAWVNDPAEATLARWLTHCALRRDVHVVLGSGPVGLAWLSARAVPLEGLERVEQPSMGELHRAVLEVARASRGLASAEPLEEQDVASALEVAGASEIGGLVLARALAARVFLGTGDGAMAEVLQSLAEDALAEAPAAVQARVLDALSTLVVADAGLVQRGAARLGELAEESSLELDRAIELLAPFVRRGLVQLDAAGPGYEVVARLTHDALLGWQPLAAFVEARRDERALRGALRRVATEADLARLERRALSAAERVGVRRLRAPRRTTRLALATAVTALLVSVGVAAVAIERVSSAERAASTARVDTETARSGTRRIAELVTGRLRDRLDTIGRLDVLDEVFDETAAALAPLAHQGDVDAARLHAVALRRVAAARVDLGQAAQGFQIYRDANAELERLAGQHPRDPRVLRELGVSVRDVGDLQAVEGSLEDSLVSYARSVAILEPLARQRDDEARDALASSYDAQGDALDDLGRYTDARAAYAKSLELREMLLSEQPGDTRRRQRLASALTSLGDLQLHVDLPGARAWHERALVLREQLCRDDPRNALWQRDLTVTLERLGDLDLREERPADALARFERTADIARMLLAREPSSTRWRGDLAASEQRVASALVELGRADAALVRAEEAVSIRRALLSEAQVDPRWTADLAASLDVLGDVQVARGDAAAARGTWESSAAQWTEALSRSPDRVEWQANLDAVRTKLTTP